MTTNYADAYLSETSIVANRLSREEMESLALELAEVREGGGRVFIAGIGGSAANASHAANDFRKLLDIEAYCLSDNVAELTARANDEGWDTIYAGILGTSEAVSGDALLVLSVGGGAEGVSAPLVKAIDYALANGMKIYGIVGRDGGYTKKHARVTVMIPDVACGARVTPHTEGFQSIVLHYLASHPDLQRRKTKW